MLRPTLLVAALLFSSAAFAQSDFKIVTTVNPENENFSGVELVDHFSQGGAINLYTEDGQSYGAIQPLFSGTGGYFQLDAQNGATGFEVGRGTGPAGVRVTIGAGGTQRSVFDSGDTGTDSVVLPLDAIDNTEILNESGVANNRNGSTIFMEPEFNLTLAQSIVAPADGFIVAMGTIEVGLSHTTGTASTVQVSVGSDLDCDATPVAPTSQQTNIGLPSGAASGLYRYTSTAQGLFNVDSGEVLDFCLVVFEAAGTDARVDDQNLTLMYFPTSYGTVLSNETPELQPSTFDESDAILDPLQESDVAFIREGSILDNQERIAGEIRMMREKLDALEQQMLLKSNQPK